MRKSLKTLLILLEFFLVNFFEIGEDYKTARLCFFFTVLINDLKYYFQYYWTTNVQWYKI